MATISFSNLLEREKVSGVEMYKMLDPGGEAENHKILLVKRISITFDEDECQMLNFTNITTFHKFKREEEKSRLLQALNTSIHHEMLGPLGTSVMIADRLMAAVDREEHKQMVKLVQTCSNLALFHANDLLDYKVIQHGSFTPTYTNESIAETIHQTI